MVVKFYNRRKKSYEVEKIAGDRYLNWVYSSPSGMTFLELLIKKKVFSRIYGLYCDTRLSSLKINKFIRDFNIDMSLSKDLNFNSFNEFFIRRLNSSARPITSDKNTLISPCDGKILAYTNIDIQSLIQVKGITYKLSDLVKNDEVISNYKNGSCLVFRLCPSDYHRFHFVDSGLCSKTFKIKGSYYSVNPIALKCKNNLFCENKREWSVFHSNNFDDILYVEVGATCVGSIFQTYTPNIKVKKGDEKGYFKFGGSTVILFFKKDTIKIQEDILHQTNLGYETSVFLGENIGTRS
ncbi:phosphatidylserine decarboxylase [Haloimpatiens sp. FM7315]|uniref:phosphatidylserine decarboxylase n=1 Tax=Haloimpatiens sp. FM7315 TaxID=3298609 RepID=UPI00370C721A